jgi:hypothetical protein
MFRYGAKPRNGLPLSQASRQSAGVRSKLAAPLAVRVAQVVLMAG